MSADSQSKLCNLKLLTKLILFWLVLIFLVIKPASNKLGILEEDDEFEEFPVEGKTGIFIFKKINLTF